jgi:GTP-binding protein Era
MVEIAINDDGATTGPGRACGFVAIVGAPNVGKSTLVNALVGTKVSIVSPRSQTTRARVRGIFALGATQVVLVDTPGLMTPKRMLDRAMISAALGSLDDADVVLVLVDGQKGRDAAAERVTARLRARRRPACLAINKVDIVDKRKLLPMVAGLTAGAPVFDRVFMVSARTRDGVDDLRRYLAERMPNGPWLYPADMLTDTPEALQAAEVTREQVFLQLRDEVPRSTAVVPVEWRDVADGSLRIEQTVYVERDSQRPILIGEDGQRIRQIGEKARLELERLFGCRVHLFLTVQVRRQWPDGREAYTWHQLERP